MTGPAIIPHVPSMRRRALDLVAEAWTPIFPQMRREVPGFACAAFYPDGWEARQLADVGALLDGPATSP